MRSALAAAAGLLALATATGGCFTYGVTSRGRPVDVSQLEALAPGSSTLADVTAAIGAPMEVHHPPDGLMLVYRAGTYRFWRLGLDAGLIVGQVPGASFPGSENLKFTYEKGGYLEDRLVFQFDRNHVLTGVGYEPGEGARP